MRYFELLANDPRTRAITVAKSGAQSEQSLPRAQNRISRTQLSPIEAIGSLHPGDGAFVTFHREVAGDTAAERWQNLGAIEVSKLHNQWPNIEPFLSVDSYFSLSSTYEQKFSRPSRITGLPIYFRKEADLRWLNCSWVDIDCYKVFPDRTPEQVFDDCLSEAEKIGLPAPGFASFSGRGFWMLWPLRDFTDRNRPVRAYEDKCDIHNRVNRALVVRFAHFGADIFSADPSRVMRVPGSYNSKADGRQAMVEFFKLGTDVVTFPAMAGILGVAARKTLLPRERTSSATKNAAKVFAAHMRWRVPLDGFLELWKMRRCFQQGVRHNAVYIYAALLRRNRTPETTIAQNCMRLAVSCEPPLTNKDVHRCIDSSHRLTQQDFRHSISNAAIARMLKIADKEKECLSDWFRPKSRPRKERIKERRDFIRQALVSHGRSLDRPATWFSLREMRKLLKELHGIDVTHATVFNDYQSLKGKTLSAPLDGFIPTRKKTISLMANANAEFEAWMGG